MLEALTHPPPSAHMHMVEAMTITTAWVPLMVEAMTPLMLVAAVTVTTAGVPLMLVAAMTVPWVTALVPLMVVEAMPLPTVPLMMAAWVPTTTALRHHQVPQPPSGGCRPPEHPNPPLRIF